MWRLSEQLTGSFLRSSIYPHGSHAPPPKKKERKSLHMQRQFCCCWDRSEFFCFFFGGGSSNSVLMIILGNQVTALFSASSPRAAMNSSKPVDSWKWCQFSKNSENSQHYLWQSAWNISYKIQNPDWDLCLVICQYCQKENYLKNKLAKHVRGKRPTLFRNKLVFWLPDLIRNGLTTYPIFWDMNCFFQLEKYINLISSC